MTSFVMIAGIAYGILISLTATMTLALAHVTRRRQSSVSARSYLGVR